MSEALQIIYISTESRGLWTHKTSKRSKIGLKMGSKHKIWLFQYMKVLKHLNLAKKLITLSFGAFGPLVSI